ncbi:CrcB family protein [Microbacterium sp. C7(2022)]|uniref:fluoride efflux transporter FluC n=1 Tax=Microbacterium sp. C7(2022) TaxID=2992759 RepID=UPI00237B6ED8|nr:CrcB family protein [Microbacterium sp. C7(2022)]MDE0545113.1 CrcB family protein [Microbacterium sp. C7(2022)]
MSTGVLVALAIAGGVGAGLRYILDRLWPSRDGLTVAWGIFIANVTGSFALGLLTGFGAAINSDMVLVIGTGLLGGYTTFSTVSVESVLLAERRQRRASLITTFCTLVAALAAAAAGFGLAFLLQ